MLLILLSLWIAIQDSHQACNAMYPYQVIGDPVPWIYLVPPLDDQLYVPCAGNYTATAYSGDPNKGLGNLSMEYFASISGQYGTLTITSGDGTHPADSITITSSDDAKKYANWVSTSPNVTITWQQNGTKAYDFSGALMETPTLQQSTVIPSTSPAPTTRAYTPGYVDPWLVSHDLFIGIDAGMKPSAQFFNDMKNLALNFSTQFELYAGPFTTAPKSHTRVSILQLTPVDKYATNGGLWEHTNGSIVSVLGGMIHYNADIANYTNTLKEAADQAFTVMNPGDPNYAQGTRPHAMRTFIIFTNQAPKDIAALNAPCGDEADQDDATICNIFRSKDIRLIVAGYQVDDISRSNFTYKNSWYKYTDVDANNWDNYFTKIIARFFTNSTGLCDNRYTKQPWDIVKDGDTKIFEPLDYSGPPLSSPEYSWPFVNGERSRYCNFQNNRYYIMNNGNLPICLTVYHDLEVERDWIRVYEFGGDQIFNEIESFTGLGVMGSKVMTNQNLFIHFQTDNEEVYRGFYMKIEQKFCTN